MKTEKNHWKLRRKSKAGIANAKRIILIPQRIFKLKSPRGNWSILKLETKYVVSDPPNVFYRTNETVCKCIPLVVRQIQMETIYKEWHKKMHSNEKKVLLTNLHPSKARLPPLDHYQKPTIMSHVNWTPPFLGSRSFRPRETWNQAKVWQITRTIWRRWYIYWLKLIKKF